MLLHEDGGHEHLVRDGQMVFTCSGPTSFALLPLVSGNNTGAAARSKIGLSKWDILAFKCTTRMGVFALILSSLSLRRQRMEKTGMFSRGVKPGLGLLRLDWGWEVLDAVLGCQCSIPQHPRQWKRMFFGGGHGVSLCTAKAVAGKGDRTFFPGFG